MRNWTDKEIRLLRTAYNNEPVTKIALTLGRSEQSIRNKVHAMRSKGYTFNRVKDRPILSVADLKARN
jgi:biotin operon repressor